MGEKEERGWNWSLTNLESRGEKDLEVVTVV